jgi:DTW domain-containing protein YfiP
MALFLFPHEGATPLGALSGAAGRQPVTLIVPDGNWRQASKVRNRVPGLREVPCVSLPPGAPSTSGLSTIEAIARAMGLLEGEPVRRALERVFHAMVERTLWARGLVATAEVTGGIPEGTLRQDPRITTSRPDSR